MKKTFLTILFLLGVSGPSRAASLLDGKNWNVEGDFNTEVRVFPIDDEREHTQDSTLDFSARLKAEFEHDIFRYKFSGLARRGMSNDARNVLVLEENYLSREFESFAITAGWQIHSWNILEGFNVSDVVNSRNLDGDYDLEEKFGELTFSWTLFAENFTLSVFYFPQYVDLFWPKSKSRMSPVVGNQVLDQADVGNSVWVEGDNIIGDEWGHQGAIKLDKSFEEQNVETSLYILHHMDRMQPFLTVAFDQRLRGHHFRVTQYGANISKIHESWIFKFEGAWRDYDNDRIQPILGGPVIHPRDHALITPGLEKNLTIVEGVSSTFFVEYQKIVGISFEESEQYGIFQNDVFVGLRSDFNNVLGSQLTFAGYFDLDKKYEYAINATYSQRMTDSWKFHVGGRIVGAEKSANPTGLQLFRDSDQIFTKVTFFF